jgi:hypothetical protein
MVSHRPAGRPRHGAVRKDRSVSAARAYIAGRLAGQLDQSFLADDLGVALNMSAVNRAAGQSHWRPPNYKPRGQAAGRPPASSGTAIRDWLAIRASELQLGVGLVAFPVAGAQAQRQLYRDLQAVAGVVQLLRAGDGRDRQVLALVLTDGEDERRRLRSALDEFADNWKWAEVDEETVEPAVQTWRHLAVVAARRDGLLAS